MNSLQTILLAATTLTAGCSGQPGETTTAEEQSDPQNEATTAETPVTAPAAYSGGIAGSVTETMNSGGYTYVQVDTGAEKVWAAVPEVAVSVGDDVKLQPGMPMQNYTSNTLGRTFDVVYFSGGLASTVAMPAGHSGATGSTRAPTATGVDLAELSPVDGGQTVAEVFAGKDTLVGNEVVLRGKVVKFSGGILGTNFMHVQDGTGGEGTNDLTITSKVTVNVGDTVVVRGVLVANKDFGFGYQYDLIIEDAAVTVE